jgi:preprotein translocase subunit YajC
MPSFHPPASPALLLAQGASPPEPGQVILQVLPFLLVGLFAWMLLVKPERERLKRQQDLLGALKKNDRVLTASGIYGTVANVDRESGRVTLKVDEAANVKIQVALSTIASVVDGSNDASSPPG